MTTIETKKMPMSGRREIALNRLKTVLEEMTNNITVIEHSPHISSFLSETENRRLHELRTKSESLLTDISTAISNGYGANWTPSSES